MALLSSWRHRPEDLALWAKLALADRLNYHLRCVEAKAQRSLASIREFTRRGACYLAVSWGKDSTVAAHLLWRLVAERHPYAQLTPAYRVVMPGIETPGTDEVERAFLGRFPLTYERVEVPHDPSWVRAEGRRERALSTGIAAMADRAGTPRWIGGLRAEESASRRLGARAGGIRGNQCSPMISWRPADVFAYLAAHDLPVHPNYAMTAGGFWDRDKLRVCMLGNHRGRQYGRLLWEEWYYGDVLDQMRTLHPNLVPE